MMLTMVVVMVVMVVVHGGGGGGGAWYMVVHGGVWWGVGGVREWVEGVEREGEREREGGGMEGWRSGA